jgi:hypothetical protein
MFHPLIGMLPRLFLLVSFRSEWVTFVPYPVRLLKRTAHDSAWYFRPPGEPRGKHLCARGLSPAGGG